MLTPPSLPPPPPSLHRLHRVRPHRRGRRPALVVHNLPAHRQPRLPGAARTRRLLLHLPPVAPSPCRPPSLFFFMTPDDSPRSWTRADGSRKLVDGWEVDGRRRPGLVARASLAGCLRQRLEAPAGRARPAPSITTRPRRPSLPFSFPTLVHCPVLSTTCCPTRPGGPCSLSPPCPRVECRLTRHARLPDVLRRSLPLSPLFLSARGSASAACRRRRPTHSRPGPAASLCHPPASATTRPARPPLLPMAGASRLPSPPVGSRRCPTSAFSAKASASTAPAARHLPTAISGATR